MGITKVQHNKVGLQVYITATLHKWIDLILNAFYRAIKSREMAHFVGVYLGNTQQSFIIVAITNCCYYCVHIALLTNYFTATCFKLTN